MVLAVRAKAKEGCNHTHRERSCFWGLARMMSGSYSSAPWVCSSQTALIGLFASVVFNSLLPRFQTSTKALLPKMAANYDCWAEIQMGDLSYLAGHHSVKTWSAKILISPLELGCVYVCLAAWFNICPGFTQRNPSRAFIRGSNQNLNKHSSLVKPRTSFSTFLKLLTQLKLIYTRKQNSLQTSII